MAGFSTGEERNKLIILLLMRELNAVMTSERIFSIVFEGEFMSYFDYQNAMYELEETGWIAAVPGQLGQSYGITSAGEAALVSLGDTVPAVIRNRLSECAKKNRDALLDAARFPTSMEELADGTYMVRLSVNDGNKAELQIEMHVQSREMAVRMRQNWKGSCYPIYSSLFNTLLKDVEQDLSADQ